MPCRKLLPCVCNIYLFKSNGTCIVFQHYATFRQEPYLDRCQTQIPQKHSCRTRLITTIVDMACNLCNSTQIDAVILDFATAFDIVSHQRRLLKVEYYGIRSNTLPWRVSFHNNRKQCVIVEGVSSSVVPVASGVKQGTVLGPLLFLIFINDMPESITSSAKSFADDCLVYRTIHSTNDATILQEDLDQLGL